MQEKKFTRAKIVIDALRGHYGEKVGEFAKRLGVSASTVSTWASRDSLDEDLIFRKCEGVRFEFLLTGKGKVFEDSLSAKTHLAIPTKEIPILGRISAGFPNLASQEVIEYISIPGAPINSFALIVRGRSMSPTLYDGDYVIFIQNGEYKSEDILIVLDEWGDAMVKRLKIREGKHYLVSDNLEYPVVEPNENYRVVGKVVKVWRDIKF